MNNSLRWIFILCAAGIFLTVNSNFAETVTNYRNPDEITAAIKEAAKNNKLCSLEKLGETPGGRDINLVIIGDKKSDSPAILVVANMDGDYPIASEAALNLIDLLLNDWKSEADNLRWYIFPAGNPDGYSRYFDVPLDENFGNGKTFNNDNDDAYDEDGPEDLNGDEYITSMRQLHPEGKWIPSEEYPLLMRKVDHAKGEAGKYRIFEEGIDNDGDGEINEDGVGGIIPGHNFPHRFEHYTTTDGLWAGSEEESRAVMRFAYDHPEIAMMIVFGRSNTLLSLPEDQKIEGSSGGEYTVPDRYAKRLGLDEGTKLPLKKITELFRDMWGNHNLSEDRVLTIISDGAVVNPDKKDAAYWRDINDKYKTFLEENDIETKRLDPPGFPSGSVAEWGYFQYGVPAFSMDFWTVPEVVKPDDSTAFSPEKIEKMSDDEFKELDESKLTSIIERCKLQDKFTSGKMMESIASGKLSQKRLAKMMRKSSKSDEECGIDKTELALVKYSPESFLEWKPYNHPTLGEVEIGGKIPYSDITPKANEVEKLIAGQLPFISELTKMMPKLKIDKIETEDRGNGIWKIETWIKNEGFLPYPTYQGKRSRRPVPASVTIDGKSISVLEGKKRAVLGLLPGSGGAEKVSWLVKAESGKKITIGLKSFSAGSDEKEIILKGGK